MNIQQKITELEEQSRFLQTQAQCLQMMQNMSSSQDKRPQEGSMIPYVSQQMMQMQPYAHQHMQMQLYAPPHALNNQETIIKTTTIRRAKLPAMQGCIRI